MRDGRLLLARSPAPGGGFERVQSGGGTEHGEDPYDTVVREVEEETGHRGPRPSTGGRAGRVGGTAPRSGNRRKRPLSPETAPLPRKMNRE